MEAAPDRQQLLRQVQILHLQRSPRPPYPIRHALTLWTRTCITVTEGTKNMLWTICVILLILWALGMATSYTAGGLIHILLLIAVVVLLFRVIQGRRIV